MLLNSDVTTPGLSIVRAKSYLVNSLFVCKGINDGCGLTIKSGIAIVAGGAALIAQYFKSGRWADKTELDGSTQRAIIFNSSQHPQEKKAPDIYFGY